jgi:hypothetical protein
MSENGITTFSAIAFGIWNNQKPELQGGHLPFLVALISLICDIDSNEFDANQRIMY